MKKRLSLKEIIFVASMLFGLFFGAGNLIFPVHMGQLAGSNTLPAVFGFIITGVGLPLIGVAAIGISRSTDLFDLGKKVGKPYAFFFTCALYLTIGPAFAIPRCATTSFTVGIEPMLGENANSKLILLVFSVIFFAIVLFFSLRPSGILTWVGKIINPIFLVFLALLLIVALTHPIASVSEITPDPSYQSGAFFQGFLEGYNTMDALAGLAFGIIVITVIKYLGVKEEGSVAIHTLKAGIFSSILMAVIYIAVTVMGAQSRGLFEISENGGIAFAQISNNFFGKAGILILAITVSLACLKTAIGLITSCSEIFMKMFPKSPGYKFWAVLFVIISFLIANVGLTAIITYAVPVLMFLYPLAITLMLLAIFGRLFKHAKCVYISVTVFTLLAAVFDFIKALPEGAANAIHADVLTGFAGKVFPLYDLGLGWTVPAIIGLVVGLIIYFVRKKSPKAA
ncbi:MAG: branched-chain amino acid transport system II carrier protein [Lachnospiraceae bacterium]|nr:branched-chain amino acid transport system II carrier protein [Lachnospiraceae bacterium]